MAKYNYNRDVSDTNPFPAKIMGNVNEKPYRFLEKTEGGDPAIGSFILEPNIEYTFAAEEGVMMFRNFGAAVAYYGPVKGANEENWPVMAGGRSGPLSAGGNLYFYTPGDEQGNGTVIYYAYLGV